MFFSTGILTLRWTQIKNFSTEVEDFQVHLLLPVFNQFRASIKKKWEENIKN